MTKHREAVATANALKGGGDGFGGRPDDAGTGGCAQGVHAAGVVAVVVGDEDRVELGECLAYATAGEVFLFRGQSTILREAGARDVVSEAPLPYAGWHLLGTARMGRDPETSVVNQWGRSHDVKNLFIVDGSVFVTSGGVNGLMLASSVVAQSIWAIPEDVDKNHPKLRELAKLLDMPLADLKKRLANEDKTFVWIKRQVDEPVAKQIAALDIKGIYQRREYKRQYPEGEAAAHVVGFTNFEEQGQEGIELAFQKQLQGHNGSRSVVRDRLGRVVEDIGESVAPVDGHDTALSIDSKVQFFAWQKLRDAGLSLFTLVDVAQAVDPDAFSEQLGAFVDVEIVAARKRGITVAQVTTAEPLSRMTSSTSSSTRLRITARRIALDLQRQHRDALMEGERDLGDARHRGDALGQAAVLGRVDLRQPAALQPRARPAGGPADGGEGRVGLGRLRGPGHRAGGHARGRGHPLHRRAVGRDRARARPLAAAVRTRLADARRRPVRRARRRRFPPPAGRNAPGRGSSCPCRDTPASPPAAAGDRGR